MAEIVTTYTGQKPDIKQTFSREIEQNYSFLFDIIWNDKLRVSRTSFKFESNIIESRIYHVIYPKNVTWRVTWPTTTHVKHPKDGLQEIFSRTIFKMKMLNKPSAPKLKKIFKFRSDLIFQVWISRIELQIILKSWILTPSRSTRSTKNPIDKILSPPKKSNQVQTVFLREVIVA